MIQGTVSSVIYQNYENGYSVLRLSAQDGRTVTVVGTIPLAVAGERLVVTGRWNNHAAYGKQFEASNGADILAVDQVGKHDRRVNPADQIAGRSCQKVQQLPCHVPILLFSSSMASRLRRRMVAAPTLEISSIFSWV